MAEHNQLGIRGEKLAAVYLSNKGYKILECNWRHRKWEIDIITSTDEFIIFVEVKTRQTDKWGNPEEAVSDRKIIRMVEAADYYVQEYDIHLPVRFDIISITKKGNTYKIDHFEDAFYPPLL